MLMLKAILFDADGVVLEKYKEYFSVKFAREYGAPLADITSFFNNEFGLCIRGKADVREILTAKLPGWNWDKGAEEFQKLWYAFDVHPDEKVLAEVKKFRQKGLKCYLVSDQEKYRAEFLENMLAGMLDGYFFSYQFGHTKHEPEFFKKLLAKMHVKPEEVLYIDDDPKNIDVARSLGIDARVYKTIADMPRVSL